MQRTGLVMDDLFVEHDPGPGHPESPQRLVAIHDRIVEEGLVDRCLRLPPRQASRAEICRIHEEAYYKKIEKTDGKSIMLDPDTSTSPKSFRAASFAAGGTIALVEGLVASDLDNGYAMVRPPGHHAERGRAMGFCLFNNIAIAAEHAIRQLGLSKVLVFDWDLHHGNGTMHSFFDRSDVLYLSTHQYPYYPGTGALEEVGRGQGAGATVNLPLPPGMGDVEFRALVHEVIKPIVQQYEPELILLSTGFDTHRLDPLGGMKMTAEGYGVLTSDFMELSEGSAQGRLGLVLEGGYHLEGLSHGVANCLKALLGDFKPEAYQGDLGSAKAIIDAVKKVQSRFWTFD